MRVRIVQVTDVKKVDGGDYVVEFLMEPSGWLSRMIHHRTKRRVLVGDCGITVTDLYTGMEPEPYEMRFAAREMVRRFRLNEIDAK